MTLSLDGLVDSVAGPIRQWGRDWRTAIQNPRAMKPKQWLSLILPNPFQGATLSWDIDHPESIPYQTAIIGGASYGANSYAAAAAAEAEAANMALYGPEYAKAIAVAERGGAVAGTTAPAAGGGISGAIKSGAGFIKDAATVSLAARQILSPWERAIKQVGSLISGGGGDPGLSGSGRPVVSSSGALPGEGPTTPIQASAGNPLVIGLAVTAAAGLAWTLLRGSK